eukprot:GFYU01001945.1.p1 GENE.GFYU01001945.1~~GFYU01001945.1.p1  ORF type:complete len:869 (-),score=243.47 GFYU01001945.1:183-2789(-)
MSNPTSPRPMSPRGHRGSTDEISKTEQLIGKVAKDKTVYEWVNDPLLQDKPLPTMSPRAQRRPSAQRSFGIPWTRVFSESSSGVTSSGFSPISLVLGVACVFWCWQTYSLTYHNGALEATNAELQSRYAALYKQFEQLGEEPKPIAPTELVSGVCAGATGAGEGDDNGGDEEEGATMLGTLALAIFFGACAYIAKFVIAEVQAARDKVAEGTIEATVGEILAYRVDYYFSVTAMSKPFFLLGSTFFLILVGGVVRAMTSSNALSHAVWQSWIWVADAAAHADESDPGDRALALIITLGGMVVFGFMVGILTDMISEKVEDLKKGKSRVVEANHTLILGWSDKVLPIIHQLAIANESEGGGCVVVMAERDKEEMEIEIMDAEGVNPLGTRIVCRSGSPLMMSDLKKVSASTAKSVIVLADREVDADESDARALRIVLSLTGLGQMVGHAVIELCDVDNEELVHLVSKKVETVVSHDMIGRLMLQCTLQPGLAFILEDMLGFEGCELYVKEWPELVGCKFNHLPERFPDAIPVGVKPNNGVSMLINPDGDYVMQEGDELLCLAEDDDSYEPHEAAALTGLVKLPLAPPEIEERPPRKILFVGWRRDLDDMIAELDQFVPPGSELVLLSSVPIEEREKRFEEGGLCIDNLQNLIIRNEEGNPVLRRHLERLPLAECDSVLILADSYMENDTQTTDSRSLASLLLIRDIQHEQANKGAKVKRRRTQLSRESSTTTLLSRAKEQPHHSTLISEILDSRTKSLISMASVSDYVASNELVSKVIAMVSEQREINQVLSELLSAEGNETYIRDIRLYCDVGEKLSFWDMCKRAQLRDEVAIGYKLVDCENAFLNPEEKSARRIWNNGDMLVVIADD